MTQLSGTVAIHDIADSEAFVRACINKARGLQLTLEQREELVAEGLVLLWDLARRYDPAKDTPNRKPGHRCRTEKCCKPSFAGYASHLLPRKLSDAWHHLNEHHVLKTQDDGKRRWQYHQTPASYDAQVNDVAGLKEHAVRLIGNFITAPLATSIA